MQNRITFTGLPALSNDKFQMNRCKEFCAEAAVKAQGVEKETFFLVGKYFEKLLQHINGLVKEHTKFQKDKQECGIGRSVQMLVQMVYFPVFSSLRSFTLRWSSLLSTVSKVDNNLKGHIGHIHRTTTYVKIKY